MTIIELMNFTSLLGLAIAFSILGLGIIFPSVKPDIFLDNHAIMLVFGGTLAASLIAYPLKTFRKLFNLFTMGFLMKKRKSQGEIIKAIYLLSRGSHSSFLIDTALASHPFLREGYYLMKEKNLSAKDLFEILSLRAETFRKAYMNDAKVLISLGKYPPAFGLLGASTGMIAMMTNLGKGGAEAIGPAMATALVATFWGIAFANFVLLPMSDYAYKIVSEDADLRQIIVKGIMLVNAKVTPEIALEKLLSLVPYDLRIEVIEELKHLKSPTMEHYEEAI